MSVYCLENGKIQEVRWEDASGWKPEVIFHLNVSGEMSKIREIPLLSEGEGVLAYSGEFFIEALEIQIEFLKAVNAEKWLEALILRHADRVRQVSEDIFVMAEIKGVDI